MFLPHPRVKVSIVGSLRDREVTCPASDRQGSNFESCVWRTVSSQSSHHPQEVLLAQFSLYVHKGGLKPDSFHFMMLMITILLVFSLMVDAPLVTRLIMDFLWYHPCVVQTASNVASSTELCLCGIFHHLMYVILLITLLLYPV